jgi:hypothetical protein
MRNNNIVTTNLFMEGQLMEALNDLLIAKSVKMKMRPEVVTSYPIVCATKFGWYPKKKTYAVKVSFCQSSVGTVNKKVAKKYAALIEKVTGVEPSVREAGCPGFYITITLEKLLKILGYKFKKMKVVDVKAVRAEIDDIDWEITIEHKADKKSRKVKSVEPVEEVVEDADIDIEAMVENIEELINSDEVAESTKEMIIDFSKKMEMLANYVDICAGNFIDDLSVDLKNAEVIAEFKTFVSEYTDVVVVNLSEEMTAVVEELENQLNLGNIEEEDVEQMIVREFNCRETEYKEKINAEFHKENPLGFEFKPVVVEESKTEDEESETVYTDEEPEQETELAKIIKAKYEAKQNTDAE